MKNLYEGKMLRQMPTTYHKDNHIAEEIYQKIDIQGIEIFLSTRLEAIG